ncbi:hypothetical protein COL5a_008668 [Colletotrichum fioriniae]|uniref:uncharacterized protein n=1 Tax=Colletotrichum fioriniae TaxID=710243 RepID=UPI0023009F18|nr:uncharacterized protein COL516b_010922 [Colletotrichum fioriniae]KAJ0297182.1 hypothetical protein COL516b_010922 [Colletotrichum fioriniae]KAJ0322840.1 hypothetical protein COL5a_008668 [Colletotrichum fioriniae]KAJ3943706.1 hypothetical protein N0V96_006637 [Colletotrichum fioriniae]
MSRMCADSDYYCSGSILTLTKYRPVQPHGTSQYPPNPPPGPELCHFDPHRYFPKDEQLQLEVLERLSENPGPQVFRCKIIALPSPEYTNNDTDVKLPIPQTQVVAKVFDQKLWPEYNGTSISNIELADGALSRESCVYQHLYRKNLTGPPHLTAQYYGTWAVRFAVGKTPEGRDQYKTVALILMEYIDGYSIEDLCNRDEYGNLIPDDELPLEFHQSDTGRPVLLDINHDTRMEVFRQLIDGNVRHMHTGVMDGDYEPRHVYITMRDGTRDLDKPRTVLFDLSRARLWSTTKNAKHAPDGIHCFELVPHPIHPYEVASAPALGDFAGWFPQEWFDETVDGDASKGSFRNWLIEAFGPLQEGPNYSTCQTVERAMAKRDREDALSKMKAAIIERGFPVSPYPPLYHAAATLEIPQSFRSLNISHEPYPAHVSDASLRESSRHFDAPFRVEIPPTDLQPEAGASATTTDSWDQGGSAGEASNSHTHHDQPVL